MPEEAVINQTQTGLEGAEGRFNELFKPSGDDGTAIQNDALGAPPAKPAEAAPVTEKPATGKPAAEEFPTEFLTGEKPAEKSEPADADIKKLLEAEPPPQLRSEAAKESFKTWKSEAAKVIEARNARIAEQDRMITELKASGTQSEEVKAQLKDRDDRLAENQALIERIAFERSPKFQKFVKAEQGALEGAKEYLKGTEVNPDVIDLAATLTGSQRLKALREAGADAETISAILPYLAQRDLIHRDKTEALDTAKVTLNQWEAEQKQAEAQKQVQQRAEEDRIFKEAGAEVAKEFEPFQRIPGNDAWNAQVDQLEAEANEFFSGNIPLKDVARIARYGVGAKVLHKMFHSLQGKYQAVVTENKQLKAAQPGGGTLQNGERKAQPENLMERSVQTFEGLMHGGQG